MKAHGSGRRSPAKLQRGGFLIGFVVGLLVGLAAALAVALYVTKAPVPFVNKVPSRSPTQDAAEAERNRNWDPNSALAGKNQIEHSQPDHSNHERYAETAQEIVHAAHRPHHIELVVGHQSNCRSDSFAGTCCCNSDSECINPSNISTTAPVTNSRLPHLSFIVASLCTLEPALLQHGRRYQLLLNVSLQRLDRKLPQIRALRLRPGRLRKALYWSAKHLRRQHSRVI